MYFINLALKLFSYKDLSSVSGESGFIFDTFIYNTNLVYITNTTGLQHQQFLRYYLQY